MRLSPSRIGFLIVLIVLLVVGGLFTRSMFSAAPVDDAQRLEALRSFDVVYSVLQHPRCMNCHPSGDKPLQFDDRSPHSMNVKRGRDGRGTPGGRCLVCHGKGNLPGEHMAPGVSSEWRLAPLEMVFEGVPPQEMAARLADPKQSHLSPEELVEHVTTDPVVLWGWEPGEGRTPVPVPHEEFVGAFTNWVEAGMPAPPSEEGEES